MNSSWKVRAPDDLCGVQLLLCFKDSDSGTFKKQQGFPWILSNLHMCNSWEFNLELKSKSKAMPVRTFPLATFAVSTILICLATLLSRNLCLRFCLFFFWILETCVFLGSSQRILSRFWFYFSIENTQQDQRIIFNLVSFSHFQTNTNTIVHYRWTSVNLATYSQMDLLP